MNPKDEGVLACLGSLKKEQTMLRRLNGKRLVFADGIAGRQWAIFIAHEIRKCGGQADFTKP